MKLKLSIAIILLAGLAACKSTNDVSSWESQLAFSASELNKGLPMMVDSETRLDSTIALQNTFTYKYTMINYALSDLDVGKFTEVMTKQTTNVVCTTPDMANFIKNKTIVNYIYFDKDSKHLSKVLIDTANCPKT
jgi:hypothetical protein